MTEPLTEKAYRSLHPAERALVLLAVLSGITGTVVAGVSLVIGSPFGTIAGCLFLLSVAVIYRLRHRCPPGETT